MESSGAVPFEEELHGFFMDLKSNCESLIEAALISAEGKGAIKLGVKSSDEGQYFADMLVPVLVHFERLHGGSEPQKVEYISLFVDDIMMLIFPIGAPSQYFAVALKGRDPRLVKRMKSYADAISKIVKRLED